MNTKTLVHVGVAAGAFALLYLIAKANAYDQPRYAYNKNVIAGFDWTNVSAGGQGDHFVGPEQHINGYTFMGVRYPHRSGHEITTVINHGFGGMNQGTTPQNADWMFNPISEVSL